MNRQKWLMLIVVATLLAGTAITLVRLNHNQKLGKPAVKNTAIADSKVRVQVDLPERVLDYNSEVLEVQKLVVDMLPKDTSFGQRLYRGPDGFTIQVNVVLMGSDRSSLHKPQFCLRGSGWVIQETEKAVVPISRPIQYDLPVTKLKVAPEKSDVQGDPRGVYVYWFVADGEYTREHWQRMWWMGRDLLTTGVLQRWAYVTCFAVCPSGKEDLAFERVKAFMAAAVPEFQLTPGPSSQAFSARE